MSEPNTTIEAFLESGPYAVVGASADRSKYGNKVLRAYVQRGLDVSPVHPKASEIEGLRCYPTIGDLPSPPRAISVITPPSVTETVVEQAIAAGVRFVWMQPGAESEAAVERARSAGLGVIAGGPCFLVVTGFHE